MPSIYFILAFVEIVYLEWAFRTYVRNNLQQKFLIVKSKLDEEPNQNVTEHLLIW